VNDIGGALSWGSLLSFIKGLGPDSALAQDLGQSKGWESTTKTNAILCDICDLLQAINNNLVAFMSGGKTRRKTKPYPRPGRDKDKNERKLGKGGLALTDLREWIRRKQEHGKR